MSLTIEPPGIAGEAPVPPPPDSLQRAAGHRPKFGWFQLIPLVLWLLTTFYIVSADERAVVTWFGRVVEESVSPGLHATWPWPISKVYRLKARQLQRSVIGGDAADTVLGRVEPVLSQFLTGDQNIIQVKAVAQYSIARPVDYLFRFEESARVVAHAVEAELGRQIAERTVDDVLTTEKVAIQEVVGRRAQILIDSYGLGVVLSTVSIDQVSAPAETADAFRDVASARADAARIISEAEGYANDVVPRARGEAQRLLSSAEAYRQRKSDEAAGDAARFTQLAREHARNPEVTRSRIYLEALEQVLPRLNKIIVDRHGNVDLTIIRGQPAQGAGSSEASQGSAPQQP